MIDPERRYQGEGGEDKLKRPRRAGIQYFRRWGQNIAKKKTSLPSECEKVYLSLLTSMREGDGGVLVSFFRR